jgi:hypothetical protein
MDTFQDASARPEQTKLHSRRSRIALARTIYLGGLSARLTARALINQIVL